jgi:ribonuclease-3
LDALDTILGEHESTEAKNLSKNEVIQVLGQQSWDKCLDLRSTLKDAFQNHALESHTSRRLSQAETSSDSAYPGENIPHLLSGLQLSGLKSCDIPHSLPPLPKILNKTLEKAVFTHQGVGTGKVSAINYEKLEWIGDTYIEHTATLLISQTFISKSTGQCAQMRERFVKNATLADYATKYGFLARADLPDSITNEKSFLPAKSSSKIKVLGDMFEAYVAAIVLSDPTYGLATATEWLKDLLSMELREDIIREEMNSTFHRQDSPLWNLRWSEQFEISAPPKIDLNPKENLQKALGGKGINISYRDQGQPIKGSDKLLVFCVGVYLTGYGAANKLLGIGKGNGKKQAGQKAAQEALDNKALMKHYIGLKKLHEERIQKEKEALEKQIAVISEPS